MSALDVLPSTPAAAGKLPMSRLTCLLLVLTMFSMVTSASAFDATEATRRGVEAYNRGDYKTAFELLKREADAGVSDAQVNLGYMYARGQGTRVDSAEALRLYGLSAARGNGEGLNALGYRTLMAVPPDRQRAVEYFCQAIFLGNPRAMNNLGLLVMEDTAVGNDRIAEARSLWTQSAERGNAGAMYNLAASLMPDDAASAMMWLRRSAEAGHEPAIRYLERLNAGGRFSRRIDTQAAMKIIDRAAVPGHSRYCVAPVS